MTYHPTTSSSSSGSRAILSPRPYRYTGSAKMGFRGLGQADMSFTLEEVDTINSASRSPATAPRPAPISTSGAKTPAGAPVSTTPYVSTVMPVATQSETNWTPWVIGGGVALLGLAGIGYAMSR